MEKLRIGIVGTGGHANSHAQQFAKEDGVEVVACCDLKKPLAKAFAQRHGIAGVYTDVGRMIDREQLDAVSVCTSDAAHAPVTLAALERGLHVLCEKPMAATVAEAEAMYRARLKAGTMGMIQFSYRGVPALERARELVLDGQLGKVMHVEASYLQSWLANTAWGDWRHKSAFLWRMSKAHHGGTLVDIGCHILDFATYVAGDIAEVACTMTSFPKAARGNRCGGYTLDADDSFVARVTFAEGALGVVHSSRWAQGHLNCLRLRVFGDKGALAIDTDAGGDKLDICLGDFHTRGALWNRIDAKVDAPSNFTRFVRSIRTGQAESPTFADGLKIQRLLAACAESSEKGRPVGVPPL